MGFSSPDDEDVTSLHASDHFDLAFRTGASGTVWEYPDGLPFDMPRD
ncbi:MAG: hypothetical protein JSS72_09285 [Armatimonadetes bacterium]|nr:hypothetical protein [Armatimonadota bacterium]